MFLKDNTIESSMDKNLNSAHHLEHLTNTNNLSSPFANQNSLVQEEDLGTILATKKQRETNNNHFISFKTFSFAFHNRF
jgi:hypothetical protein